MTSFLRAVRTARQVARVGGLGSLLALGLTLPATAQLGQVRPLSADPARAIRPAGLRPAPANGRRPASLALPLFDDFANERLGNRPDAVLWDTASGVFRNETFARNPPSRGVVSFDGLDRRGRAYGVGPGETDTLTSQPINLDGRTDVVLSFWWQAGGATGDSFAPGAQSSLTLDFDDGFGTWDLNFWQQRGADTVSAFRQAFVVIPALYLNDNFRFRFRARGNRAGSVDIWNIDYVELDANRQPQAGPVRDVAFSQPLTSPLRRYRAMPVWQLNAAANPADELADSAATTLNNLEPDPAANPTPLADNGALRTRDASGGTRVDTFLRETRLVLAASRQVPVRAPLRTGLPAVPFAPTGLAKILTSTLVLVSGESTIRTRYNDTIRAVAPLSNYYAFDDGSPELVFSIQNSTDPVAAAVAIDLNAPDIVTDIGLYLAGDLPANTRLFVDVWADDNGRPALTPLAHVGFAVPPDSVLRRTGRWHIVTLPAAVPVSGRFYVGYSQPANTVLSNIGLDVSDPQVLAGRLFLRALSEPWQRKTSIGALMIRAYLDPTAVVGLPESAALPAAWAVYPNPVSTADAAGLHLPAAVAAHGVTLLDALGRVVRTAPPGSPTLPVSGLAPGVYWLRPAATAGTALRAVRVLVTE